MSDPRIINAMGNIDDELVHDAMGRGRSARGRAIKWLSAAACLLVVFIAVGSLLPIFNSGDKVIIGGIERHYKASAITSTEMAIIYPWEYKTPSEKYPQISYNGVKYYARGSEISEQLLSADLGSITVSGKDDMGTICTESAEVSEIKDVDTGRMIALGIDGRYYVYFASDQASPATLGQLMEAYGLDGSLTLSKFSTASEGNSEKYYALSSDAFIRQTLLDCSDAPFTTDSPMGGHLSFTFTSESLGVYKRVLCVYESGYIWTNAFDYSCTYFIGSDAAGRIIDYAMSSSSPTEAEQYESSLAGVVTEIGDGYILINDTVLCVSERDGLTFKVLTDSPYVSRYIDYVGLKVGDLVVITFRGEITADRGELSVHGASFISGARLTDGDVYIAE